MSIVTELKYTANLDKGVCMTPIMPSFISGDQEAHRITVDCYRQNSREAVDLSDAGVTAYFVRADGMTIPLNGETEGNKASVLLPAACYAVMGRFSLVIKLSLGDSINTVFWGEGAVSRSRTDVVIDPDSVIPSLEELLAQIAAMEIATENANTAAQTATQAATDATNTANAAAASAQATAEAAATQAVEIATDKGNEAVQIATEQVEAQNQAIAKIATDLDAKLLTKAPAIECEASGPLVTVTDAAAQPAVQLVTHIEPVQEGEGDPSPDNVRPISGWVTANVANAVKNRLPPLVKGKSINSEDGTEKVNAVGAISPYIAWDGVTPMYLSGLPETISNFVAFYDSEQNYIGRTSGSTQSAHAIYGNYVLPNQKRVDNARYFRVTAYEILGSSTGTIDDIDNAQMQLELGTTATAFEPYQGQTLTANLPETVYGGTLDWGTGVLTVEKLLIKWNGTENWFFVANTKGPNYIYISESADNRLALVVKNVLYDQHQFLCNQFRPISYYVTKNDYDTTYFIGGGGNTYAFYNSQWSTVEEGKAFLAAQAAAGTPLTCLFNLATPRTIQLTPQQLDMLKGTNNVWSDTGDTSLVYVADTKMYIDQKLAAIAAATLNN